MKQLKNGVFEIEKEDIVLPDRSKVTNKGDCGKLLVAGGDRGMAGAPSFSAEAAYRSGVGLVEVLTHSDNRIPMQILVPEAVVSFWDSFDFVRIKTFSALTVGVGMGKSDEARKLLYNLLSRVNTPTVIDADGLNIISDTEEMLDLLGSHTVLTPHIMEFSRLTGMTAEEIKKDPIGHAAAFCKKYGTNLVLKDRTTVTAFCDGTVFVNNTGDSTLSKGGSGDVLAGIIGSFLAQGLSIKNAVTYGVYLLGKAGERAGELYGVRGALARDVIKEIAFVLKDF